MQWRKLLILLTLVTVVQAEQIISLAPNLTELVCYLGGETQLVGITGDCNYPPKIQKLTRVGKYQFPNIEALIALQPATVIAEDTADKRLLSKLDSLHIPYKLYRLKELRDLVSSGKKIAQDFSLSTKPLLVLEKKLDRKHSKNLKPALIILWQQPLIAAGPNTFVSEYWSYKGYKNIVLAKNYPVLNKEFILANPTATIINLSGTPWPEKITNVLNKQEQDIYLRLSPRLIDSL